MALGLCDVKCRLSILQFLHDKESGVGLPCSLLEVKSVRFLLVQHWVYHSIQERLLCNDGVINAYVLVGVISLCIYLIELVLFLDVPVDFHFSLLFIIYPETKFFLINRILTRNRVFLHAQWSWLE